LKTRIQISVRNLVDFALRSGDLESFFSGSGSALEAIRAHQKIQKSRGPEYTGEVSISHQVETERFLLDIVGRIDGIFLFPDRVIIDEIKTTTRELDTVIGEENPLHWGQARCYAAIYAVLHDRDEIGVQLTYYQIETGETREILRSFRKPDLEEFLRTIVGRYLSWAETIAEWCGTRDSSITALEFPFAAYREGQRAMAAAVYATVRSRGQILIQAPTGIGKTMAALFPSVKAIPNGFVGKIFYLTARTTGRTVAENALAVLRERGLRLKSIHLTAREKICFHPDAACTGEECEYARGYYDRIHAALAGAFRRDAFTRETVEEIAAEHRVCPFEFSLDLSLWMDCIICDYNYVYDLRVHLKRFFSEKSGDYLFLADEAHNLVDRARDMFSAEIRKEPFLALRRSAGNQSPEIHGILGRINTWMVGARKRCEETNPLAEKEPPQRLYPLLRKFLTLAERWLASHPKAAFREKLLELYFEVHGFMRVAEQFDDAYAVCYEKKGDDLKVKLFCLDPSGPLREAHERGTASVFFSATLTPGSYFRHIFGCVESARELILASPFPEENLCLMIAGGVSTLYTRREGTKDDIARAVHALIRGKRGNYLLFFPSYEYLRMVRERFAEISPETDCIVQTPGMTEPEREQFIARFSCVNSETLAGFAVMGGVFGEGIDLAGDRLTGAVIVGVGLPALCPERELIREYFAERSGEGFEFAYLYPGFNKVLQAAGRVIRSETDRGAALLIDSRFTSERYRALFPREWRPTVVWNETQLEHSLQRFWNE
jgi:DNA excision repair protein ERCC-2